VIAGDDVVDRFSPYLTIGEYSVNKEKYDRLFKQIRNDFMPDGVEFIGSDGQKIFVEYLKLRNAWLDQNQLHTLALSFMLTRAMLLTMSQYIMQPELFASRNEYEKYTNERLNEIRFGESIFYRIDKLAATNNKHVSLESLMKKSKADIYSVWAQYVEQYGLWYLKWPEINMKYLTTRDTVAFLGICFQNTVIYPTESKLLVQASDLVDMEKVLSLMLDAIIRNGCKFDERQVDYAVNIAFCNSRIPFYFSRPLQCINLDVPLYNNLRRSHISFMFCNDRRKFFGQ